MSEVTQSDSSTEFVATREAGLKRLDEFAPWSGDNYSTNRNYDSGQKRSHNVSRLSPWLRHRLVTEQEVISRVLKEQSAESAEKYIQEVFWRGYFKGYLEHYPSLWSKYQQELAVQQQCIHSNAQLNSDYHAATRGLTGIDCFDFWVEELRTTGYLHNHARMWFASIWIFTLRLPWSLGADFFLRYLIDGDPASNTLSWRWVAGLHTKGKCYEARASNIAKYTNGRFNPKGKLTSNVVALEEKEEHHRIPPRMVRAQPKDDFLLVVTEDDSCVYDSLRYKPVNVVGLLSTRKRSPLKVANAVLDFAAEAISDSLHRAGVTTKEVIDSDSFAEDIVNAAKSCGVKTVCISYANVGPTADQLSLAKKSLQNAGIVLHEVQRNYDSLVWPHATRGYFSLKKKIPQILAKLEDES